jgi:Mn-containing catalase
MSQLKDLLVEELEDLLHAETQLTKALPKMAEAAHNPKLRETFEKHLTQTEGQIERLKRVFELLGEKAKAKPCKAMEGLVADA